MRWRSSIFVAYSILPGFSREVAFRSMPHLFLAHLDTPSNLSYSDDNSILRGKSKSPTLGTLIRIVSALNMTIHEFLNVPEIVNFPYDDMDDSDQDDDESQE